MTLEDRVDVVSGEADKFPAGLRVLVVDDDPCCLKLVETILKKCRFKVATTSQPMEALKMLREDKNRFDVVITDVNMPGMDGFKLLELIGLEMDLPVIMLSAHSEAKYVMKGVQHGACDYLVKPCRMLELQNIWLHVFKRKHMNPKDKNNNNDNNSPNQDDEQGLAQPENPKKLDDSKAGQKRKDRNQFEEDDNGEIETEDPATTQKKPRVIWSLELHQKFVAAVTHLTIEKAVPKKILDWMNIEGLTRENVASHLQKYRLYLKRIEAAKNNQENPMRMRSIEGFGPESRRFPTIMPFSSTPPSGVLSKFNSPSRLNMNGIVSPRLIQQNTSENMNNSFGLGGNFPQSQLPELFQRNQRSLEVNSINNLSGFSYPTSFPNNRVALPSSINPRFRSLPNHLLLQGNQHVLGVAPLKSESFDIGTTASNLLGHDQSTRDWQKEVHLSKFPSTFGSLETHYHHEMPLNNLRIALAYSPTGLPSMNAVQNPQPNFLVDVPCQEGLIGSVVQTVNCTQKPNGEEHKPVFGHNPNHSAMNPLPLGDEIMGQNDRACIQNPDTSGLITQSDENMVSSGQLNAVDNPLADPMMNFIENNFLNMAQDEFFQSDFDSLDDMANTDDKHEANDGTTPMDGVFWP